MPENFLFWNKVHRCKIVNKRRRFGLPGRGGGLTEFRDIMYRTVFSGRGVILSL